MKPARRFRIYAKLLILYPPHYRKEYGEQLLQTVADMIDDAPSKNERMAVWLRISYDLPLTICKAHFQIIGDAMDANKEQNITRITIISAVLLLIPFLAFAINRMILLTSTDLGIASYYIITIGTIFPCIATVLSAHALYALLQKGKALVLSKWPLLMLFLISLTVSIFLILENVKYYNWINQ